MVWAMNTQTVIETEWPYLLSVLGTEDDLLESARLTGAWQRRREFNSASDVLRLALAYGACGMSLRQTAAWAEALGMASVSDVAVLKRLRNAGPWLAHLLDTKLQQQAEKPALPALGMRVRLIDATCISAPGSQGTDWRVHVGFDLTALSLDHIGLTDVHGGETLKRFVVGPGELAVADAGYAHRPGLWAVRRQGGHFLVRVSWQSTPLEHPDGSRVDIMALLRRTPKTGTADHPVLVAGGEQGEQPFAARLIIKRKTPEATAKARQRILKDRKRLGRNADPRTLDAAGYILILTSVDSHRLTSDDVADLYRFRWQVELAFKRLKSLIHLDELPAHDPGLARTFLLAKLLTAWLLDAMIARSQSFPPCTSSSQPVAGSTSVSPSREDCHHGRRHHLALAHRRHLDLPALS